MPALVAALLICALVSASLPYWTSNTKPSLQSGYLAPSNERASSMVYTAARAPSIVTQTSGSPFNVLNPVIGLPYHTLLKIR